MCSIPVCNRLSLVQARPQKRWLCFQLRSQLFPLCPTWGLCTLRLRSSWSPQLQKSLPRCFRHSQRSHVWQPVWCVQYVIIEDRLNICTSVVICYQTSLLWFLQSLVCPRVCKCALGMFRHRLGPESRSFPESITDHTSPQKQHFDYFNVTSVQHSRHIRDHFASPGNYMDITLWPLGTAWRHICTSLDQKDTKFTVYFPLLTSHVPWYEGPRKQFSNL